MARGNLVHRILLTALLAWGTSVKAGEVTVAVAANFAAPMQKIAAAFEADTGHKASLAFGSTGGFYSQIRNGAPFQVLLSADDETPARLEKEGLAIAGTRFTYAIGRLVLWSARPGFVDQKGDVLAMPNSERIAVANPKLAPYGAAAIETMTRLRVLDRWQARIVQGENIGQTYQFVATGNVALGFVALSQVMTDGRIGKGSGWVVPESLHVPLRQDAMVLRSAKDTVAAMALMAYLKGEPARAVMRAYGYAF